MEEAPANSGPPAMTERMFNWNLCSSGPSYVRYETYQCFVQSPTCEFQYPLEHELV